MFPTPRSSKLRFCGLILAATLALTASAAAGSQKATVSGDVENVAKQVEGAFKQLNISTGDAAVNKAFAMAVGESESGSRVTVSINATGDDECEVSITSDSPEDPDIEERFIRLMKSR